MRLAKLSINQMQDEMGFRVSITSAFQAHALSVAYRQERMATSLKESRERSGHGTGTRPLATTFNSRKLRLWPLGNRDDRAI